MPKRSDIEAQIADLQAALDGADDDEDFEVEIFKDGKGARIPFRHSKDWLTRELGISFDKPAAPGAGAAGDGGAAPAQQQGGAAVRTRRKAGTSGSGGGADGVIPDAVRGYFPGARS